MRKILALAVISGLAANASAAGFRLTNQDAKATGMGGAFSAVADDASAAWYNPAALGDLEGTNVALGTVMESPSMDHTNTAGTRTDRIESRTHVPPHFYATRKLNTKFAVGVAMNVPFGLSTQWDPVSADTRKVATYSQIKAIATNLNASYKLNDSLSVGAGASYVQLDANMDKIYSLTNTAQTLSGDGTGTGYNVAAMYKLNKWQFGANYRSKVEVDVDGKIDIAGTSGSGTGVTDRDASTVITLPDLFQIGAAYKYSENLIFSAEADYTNWTTYRRLVIDFTRNNGGAAQTIDNKNWKSVWAFRAGTEYKVSAAWKLRAGAFYDMTPVREKYFETRVPDSDRLAFSVGGGYTKGGVTVDASYMYLKFLERRIGNSVQDDGIAGGTTVLNGKYHASAMLPSVTVSYKF